MEYMLINGELYHHGIKGMKWGVRRYQNEDGSLTAAGRMRYLKTNISEKPLNIIRSYKDPDVLQKRNAIKVASDELKKEKKRFAAETRLYRKETLYGFKQNKKALKRYTSAQNKYIASQNEKKYAKEDHRNELAKKIMANSKKTKRQLELENYYRKKGMTSEEAAISAFKRDRVEKALIAAGAVAATVAVAYAIKNYRDINVDKIIKPGTKLSGITDSKVASVKDGYYYAAFKNNKLDTKKYTGFYAAFQKGGLGSNTLYEKVTSLPNGIRMASEKSATNLFKELANKDPAFMTALKKEISSLSSDVPAFTKQGALLEKANKALSAGKIDKNVYRAFNLSFVDRHKHHYINGEYVDWADQIKKYTDLLQKKGYGAIMDINDRYYSGYAASKPIIVLNPLKDVKVDSVKKLSKSRIIFDAIPAYADIQVKSIVTDPVSVISLATYGSTKVAKIAQITKRNDALVKKYRKQHPNSELTYHEIVRNYERNRLS